MEDCELSFCVDFGEVCPGAKYCKEFVMPGRRKIVSVSQDEENPSKELGISKIEENCGKIIIFFSPEIPFHDYWTQFRIKVEGDTVVLRAVGCTGGPKVKCSVRELFFTCQGEKRTIKKIIRLRNESKTPGKFQFYIDERNSEIGVSPETGTVPPERAITVTISYTPRWHGLYFKKVTCLFQYQEPLIINVSAEWYRGKKKPEAQKNVFFPVSLPEYSNNYDSFVDQNICSRSSRSMICLDKSYIDLGQVDVLNGEISAKDTFSIKNQSLINLEFIWRISDTSDFKILPNKFLLRPGEKKSLSVSFQPKAPHGFYFCEAEGIIAWGPNIEFIVPASLSLLLSGNSFERASNGWDPLLTIDPMIMMPPTLPLIPSYTTMVIKKRGHLPIFFKFIPPKYSNYTLKPMMGLIREEYQIIIIKLNPGVEADTKYEENWGLKLNTQLKVTNISISGTAQLPALMIGKNSSVKFPKTSSHVPVEMKVPIRNPTNHTIWFEVDKNNDKSKYDIQSKQGDIIFPHQEIEKKFKFTPRLEGHYYMPVRFIHDCFSRKRKMQERKTEFIVLFEGESDILSIEVLPSELDLGDIPYNVWTISQFTLRNFSPSNVPVTLLSKPKESGAPQLKIQFSPNSFVLLRNEDKKIKMSVCPSSFGMESHSVLFHINNMDNEEELQFAGKLLDFSFFSTFPKLRVVDLRVLGMERNFSKLSFWEMLQINRLNTLLKDISPGVQETVLFRIPEGQEGGNPLILQLLLDNYSEIGALIIAKFVKSCSCKPANVMLLPTEQDYDCYHKTYPQVEFSPKQIEIQPKTRSILTIKIFFGVVEYETYIISLIISSITNTEDTASVNLSIARRCFGSYEESASICEPVINRLIHKLFYPVFIGDMEPPTQAMWLFNTSGFEVTYKLIGCRSGFFQCLNKEGIIPPLTWHPLCFIFIPHEFRRYEETAYLHLGKKLYLLNLQGDGIGFMDSSMACVMKQMPIYSLFLDHVGMAHLTIDHLVIQSMEIDQVVQRIIFLTNNTEKCISFKWAEMCIPDVLNINVSPTAGILGGKEILTCLINIQSFNKPAVVSCSVNCEIVDHNEELAYQSASKNFHNISKYFDSYFAEYYRNWKKQSTSIQNIIQKPPKKNPPQYENLVLCVSTRIKRNINRVKLVHEQSVRASRSKSVFLEFSQSDPVIRNMHINSNILSRIIWEILKSDWLKRGLAIKRNDMYYNETKIVSSLTTLNKPIRHMEGLLNQSIFGVLCEIIAHNNVNRRKSFLVYGSTPSLKVHCSGSSSCYRTLMSSV